jgi:hypothetical protein
LWRIRCKKQAICREQQVGIVSGKTMTDMAADQISQCRPAPRTAILEMQKTLRNVVFVSFSRLLLGEGAAMILHPLLECSEK